jgi:nucleoside-diphosphate-sugar epimerase
VRRGSDAHSFRAAVGDDGDAMAGSLEIVHGNLGDLAAARDILRSCDAVIHIAAALEGSVASLFASNVIGTRRLVAALRHAAVNRFVLVSSLGVYAAGQLKPGQFLDEHCALDPQPHRRDPYSYSKVMQERVVWEAHRTDGLPLVVVRPGVIYGPGRGTLSARIGLRVGRTFMRMGGSQRVPYTYVDNCADAIVAALHAPGAVGHAFNIVDDDLPTGRTVLERHRRDVEALRVIPVPQAALGALSGMCEWYHRWSNGQLPAVLTRYKTVAMWQELSYPNHRAKTVLGWRPAVQFDEGLRRSNARSRVSVGIGRGGLIP